MYPVMAVVTVALSVTPGQTSSSVRWMNDYQAAQSRVADTGKPMVVVMGSGPAGLQQVVRDGGSDSALTRMLADKFVCLYVDTSTPRGRDLASAFQVADKGVVISDKSGTSQAFSASGTLSQTEMMAALERHSNGQTVRYTETVGSGSTPTGGIVLAGGQMSPGMVYQAGGPQMGTVINAGGGCGTTGMVLPAQGMVVGGPGYAAGGCGQPANGCGQAGYGRGFGFGFGMASRGWGGGGCGQMAYAGGFSQPMYASGCGGQQIVLAGGQAVAPPMAVAPAPVRMAPAPMGMAPMAVAPGQPCPQPCPTGYAHGGGCGKGFGGFGSFGGGCGGCGKGGGFGFGLGLGGWGGGFGAGFGGWGGGYGGGCGY